MSALNLYEAYTQVYDDSTLEFDDILTDEDLEIIEQLDDETLEGLVDEVISDLIIDEECEIEEIESIFEEVLSESRINRAARKAWQDKQAKDGEAVEKGKRQYKREVQRRDTINRIKGAVKSSVERAKSAVKSGVDSAKSAVKSGVERAKEAGKSAKFHGVDKHVASYANRRGLHPAPGMAARSKDPEKRRSLRSKVAGDLANRAYSAVRSGVNTVKSSAKGAVKTVASNAASGVASALIGAGKKARKFSTRMAEDVDLYDVVLEYLLDEGYAETEEAANVIMVNMSEDWKEDIFEVTGGGKVEYKPIFRGPSGGSGGRVSPQRNQNPVHRGMSSYPGHKTGDKINQLNYERSKTPKASEKRKKLETRIDKLQTRYDRDGKGYQDYV